MLVHPLWRWPRSKTTLTRLLVFAELLYFIIHFQNVRRPSLRSICLNNIMFFGKLLSRLLTSVLWNMFQAKWRPPYTPRRHRRRNEDAPRPFKCHLCTASYQAYSTLSRHMVIHRGLRFVCTLCGKTYNRKDNLKQHMRTHQENQPTTP